MAPGAKQAQLTKLLEQAAKAHRAFEVEELDGLQDANWSHWYAAFLLENGLSGILMQQLSQLELAEFFDSSYSQFEQDDPGGNWQAYTAEQMLRKFT